MLQKKWGFEEMGAISRRFVVPRTRNWRTRNTSSKEIGKKSQRNKKITKKSKKTQGIPKKSQRNPKKSQRNPKNTEKSKKSQKNPTKNHPEIQKLRRWCCPLVGGLLCSARGIGGPTNQPLTHGPTESVAIRPSWAQECFLFVFTFSLKHRKVLHTSPGLPFHSIRPIHL